MAKEDDGLGEHDGRNKNRTLKRAKQKVLKGYGYKEMKHLQNWQLVPSQLFDAAFEELNSHISFHRVSSK